jgi:hypothetical protein
MLNSCNAKGEVMALGRTILPVTLSSQIREQLQAMERSRSITQALPQRARIILLAADGLNKPDYAANNSRFLGINNKMISCNSGVFRRLDSGESRKELITQGASCKSLFWR